MFLGQGLGVQGLGFIRRTSQEESGIRKNNKQVIQCALLELLHTPVLTGRC
jgi:hypothetical protein